MTAAAHPLFGLLLAAQHFRRVDGAVFLVVVLPDGSPGTIRADATDVLGTAADDRVGDGSGCGRAAAVAGAGVANAVATSLWSCAGHKWQIGSTHS